MESGGSNFDNAYVREDHAEPCAIATIYLLLYVNHMLSTPGRKGPTGADELLSVT